MAEGNGNGVRVKLWAALIVCGCLAAAGGWTATVWVLAVNHDLHEWRAHDAETTPMILDARDDHAFLQGYRAEIMELREGREKNTQRIIRIESKIDSLIAVLTERGRRR